MGARRGSRALLSRYLTGRYLVRHLPEASVVIRMGVVGLGKMGLSHLVDAQRAPRVSVDGVCDSSGYLVSMLGKYSGLRTFTDLDRMLDEVELDAVAICTPSFLHASQVRSALERRRARVL